MSGILTLTDGINSTTCLNTNPLYKSDTNTSTTNTGNWYYYLYYFDLSRNCTLTLNINSDYVLNNLYYVIYANGGTGGKVGSINTALSATNYPGGGGGGGCGQIYPTNDPLAKDSNNNNDYVKISNPVFPYNVNANPNAVFNIKNDSTGVIASVAYGIPGSNGSGYNGGNGGIGGNGGNGSSGSTGEGGMGGLNVNKFGQKGSGTPYSSKKINFADGLYANIYNNRGGQYIYGSTSDNNGCGQGGIPGYVMFYYNVNDVKKTK